MKINLLDRNIIDNMCNNNVFSDIVTHKVAANIVYQDNLVTAFHDTSPKAPIHIIIVPNIIIPTVNDVLIEHEQLLGHMIIVSAKIAKLQNIDKIGYRLIINCNQHGGQEIYHLHIHLLGGKPLGKIICNHHY